MIPDEVVDRVREEADIVQIVSEFVRLKRVGGSFRGPCPFHQGKHDNFAVTPKGGFVCFVCGEKGDVFTFVEKRLGLDFVDAVKWVGAKAGVSVQEVSRLDGSGEDARDPRAPLWEVNAAAAEFFQRQLRDETVGAAARDYLVARGITLSDAERFSIGFAPRDAGLLRNHLNGLAFDDSRQVAAGLLVPREAQDQASADQPISGASLGAKRANAVGFRGRFRHRLMFPILDVQGRVVGFGARILGDGEPKYLNSAESAVFSKRKLLYGLNWAKSSIRRAERVIVVEGYFDAIRLALAGVEEVVAPLGTALTEDQAILIRRHTKNAYLLYDSDRAGQRATFRSGDELLRNGAAVRVITLPDGEDPDSYTAKTGAEGVERLINDSVDLFDRKVQILERGGWFSDLRRKREALDKLLPTIRATSDALTRDLYLARAAEVAGVSRDLLEREIASGSGEYRGRGRGETRVDAKQVPRGIERSPEPTGAAGGESEFLPGEAPRRPRQRRRDQRGGGVRAERELLRVLLHNPRLLPMAAEKLSDSAFLDPAYRKLFAAMRALSPDAGISELAEIPDAESMEVVQELAADSGGLAEAEAMVTGSVNAILARDIDARMSEIDRTLPLARADQKDNLILEKRQLHGQMQALGRSRWPKFGGSRS